MDSYLIKRKFIVGVTNGFFLKELVNRNSWNASFFEELRTRQSNNVNFFGEKSIGRLVNAFFGKEILGSEMGLPILEKKIGVTKAENRVRKWHPETPLLCGRILFRHLRLGSETNIASVHFSTIIFLFHGCNIKQFFGEHQFLKLFFQELEKFYCRIQQFYIY